MSTSPYQELVDKGVMTQEAADAMANSGGDPTPPVNPTEPIEPTDPNDPENPADPNEPTDPENPENPTDPAGEPASQDVFYKALGYEKDDDVVSALGELQTLRERMSSIQQKEAEINEKAQVLAKFENPYSSPLTAKIDRAIEILKVEDLSVLGKIVGYTAESAGKDPIETIVVGKILANPELLQVDGVTFEDLVQIEKRRKGDIDLEDKTSIEYKELMIEAKGALTKINTFQQSLSDVKGRYTFAHEEAQATRAKADELRVKLTPKAEELMKSGARTFNVDGIDVKVTFTKDEVASIVNNATSYAVSQGVDINTTEGLKKLGEIVGIVAKGAALQNSSYEKNLIEAAKSKAVADYIKEQSLGKPSPRSGPSGNQQKNKPSESEAYMKQLMREAGLSI
jgi:hypothetical protein